MPFDAKLDEEGIQFIIWAKKNKKSLEYIQNALDKFGDIEISTGRISQIWSANKKKRMISKENPYEDAMSSESEFNKESEDIMSGSTENVSVNKNETPSILTNKIINDMKVDLGLDKSNEINELPPPPINLEAILKNAGLRPQKQKQIIEIYSITDGSPQELKRTLEIAQVTFSQQEQIYASAYGLDYAKKIFGDKKDKTNQNEQGQDSIANAMSQASSILNQKLRNKQAEIAFEEVNGILKRLDSDGKGETSEDPMKIAKDIAAIRMLNKEDSGIDKQLTTALLENALKKNDTSIIDAMKLAFEMQKSNQPQSNQSELAIYQKEMSEMRKEQMKMQQDMTKQLIDMQMNQVTQAREADTKLTDQVRLLEKEKMELLAEQLKEKVGGSIRSPEEWMSYMSNMIENGKMMGLYREKGDGDSNQRDSLERLKTAENVLENLPDKINSGIDTAISRFEGAMIKYMEFQEKREQRLHETQIKMQSKKPTVRNARPNTERSSILNKIEKGVDNIEHAKKQRDRIRELY